MEEEGIGGSAEEMGVAMTDWNVRDWIPRFMIDREEESSKEASSMHGNESIHSIRELGPLPDEGFPSWVDPHQVQIGHI